MIDYQEQYKRKDAEVFNAVRILQSGGADTNRLFELTEKYIYKLINDIVKDPFTSGEVMEETYHQIYDELSSLSDPERFYTWAGRIATRFALKSVRKNRYLILDEESEDSWIDADLAEADTEEFIPDSVLSDAEKQRILREKIDNLTTEQRICVQFFYYEDMSVREIADAFGCNEKAIRNTLGSARKELKDVVTSMNIPATGKMYSLASVPVFYYLFRIGLNDIMAASAAGASAASAIGGSAVSGSASDGAASASSVSGGAVSGTGNSSSPTRQAPSKKKFSFGKITTLGGVGIGFAITFLLIFIGIGVANIIHPSEDRDNNIPETAVSESDDLLMEIADDEEEVFQDGLTENIPDNLTPEEYEAVNRLFEDAENMYTTYPYFGASLSEISPEDARLWAENNGVKTEYLYEAEYNGTYEGHYFSYNESSTFDYCGIFDGDSQSGEYAILWDLGILAVSPPYDSHSIRLDLDSETAAEWYPISEYSNMGEYLSSIDDIDWNDLFLRNDYLIDLGDGRSVQLNAGETSIPASDGINDGSFEELVFSYGSDREYFISVSWFKYAPPNYVYIRKLFT